MCNVFFYSKHTSYYLSTDNSKDIKQVSVKKGKLTDLEDIEPVDPAKVNLVIDDSPFFRRSRLYIESQWRQKTPTDSALCIGNRAAMNLLNFSWNRFTIPLIRLFGTIRNNH